MNTNKQKSNLEWYYKHRETQIEKNRIWKLNNKEKINAYNKKNLFKRREQKRQWKIRNSERVKQQKKKDDKKYYLKTREKQLIYKRIHGKVYYQKNREKILAWGKAHAQIPEVKARRRLMERIRNQKNPRSNRSFPLALQFIMNEVRLKQKNTCQWQGCGLSYPRSSIHVHHIFPRSEYPELEMIERYMICYCANHHALFHRYRGDKYSEMISWKEENDKYALENYH